MCVWSDCLNSFNSIGGTGFFIHVFTWSSIVWIGLVGLVGSSNSAIVGFVGIVQIVFVVEMNVFFYNKKVSIFYVFCWVSMLVFVLVFGWVLCWGWWVFVFFVHIVFKGSGVFGLEDEMDNNWL